MKLLFDENLSERLVQRVTDLYPGSSHIITLGLGGARDVAIWEAAGAEGFVLVTKDADFHRLSLMRGFPPKVIWIRVGNSSTRQVEYLLRDHRSEIIEFERDPAASFLALV